MELATIVPKILIFITMILICTQMYQTIRYSILAEKHRVVTKQLECLEDSYHSLFDEFYDIIEEENEDGEIMIDYTLKDKYRKETT